MEAQLLLGVLQALRSPQAIRVLRVLVVLVVGVKGEKNVMVKVNFLKNPQSVWEKLSPKTACCRVRSLRILLIKME